jgi:putative tryptophan/tyrosine transport system substrate-binding protein
LLQGLREFNWIDGRNARVDVRFGAGDASRRSILTKELVGSGPDVIVTGGTPAIVAIAEETRVVPTVFVQIADPVELGLFDSYAHPGGSITGFTVFEFSMGGKWLQILREIVPSIARVAVLLDTQNPSWPAYFRAIEDAAASSGIQQLIRLMSGNVETECQVFLLENASPSPAKLNYLGARVESHRAQADVDSPALHSRIPRRKLG